MEIFIHFNWIQKIFFFFYKKDGENKIPIEITPKAVTIIRTINNDVNNVNRATPPVKVKSTIKLPHLIKITPTTQNDNIKTPIIIRERLESASNNYQNSTISNYIWSN